jgi:hypothetical protein
MVMVLFALIGMVLGIVLPGPNDPGVHNNPPVVEIISEQYTVHDLGRVSYVWDLEITNMDPGDMLIPRAIASSGDTQKIAGITYDVQNSDGVNITSEATIDEISDNFIRPTTRFRLLPGESGVVRVTVTLTAPEQDVVVEITLDGLRYHVDKNTFTKRLGLVSDKVSITD